MLKDHVTKIEVDAKVRPIHFEQRRPVELEVGKQYYVSFGSHVATPCTLTKIEKREGAKTSVTIEIPIKAKSKKGFIDVNGKTSHHWVDTHSLYEDEIGLTPEQAVIHQVTS